MKNPPDLISKPILSKSILSVALFIALSTAGAAEAAAAQSVCGAAYEADIAACQLAHADAADACGAIRSRRTRNMCLAHAALELEECGEEAMVAFVFCTNNEAAAAVRRMQEARAQAAFNALRAASKR